MSHHPSCRAGWAPSPTLLGRNARPEGQKTDRPQVVQGRVRHSWPNKVTAASRQRPAGPENTAPVCGAPGGPRLLAPELRAIAQGRSRSGFTGRFHRTLFPPEWATGLFGRSASSLGPCLGPAEPTLAAFWNTMASELLFEGDPSPIPALSVPPTGSPPPLEGYTQELGVRTPQGETQAPVD